MQVAAVDGVVAGAVVHLEARTLTVQLVAGLARHLVVAHVHRVVVAVVGAIDPNVKSAKKFSHTTINYWHRMDKNYQDDPSTMALAATSSSKVDPNWYNETGATDHITSDLDRLALHEQYHGGDSVQVGNGAGLQILNTGSCSISTNTPPLALNNVLHVPEIAKHLISVHKLTKDNNVFFEISSLVFSY
jgi:hypothetical protein